VVAVSGGSDSVGLLRLLHEIAPRAGLRLSVAHLDHGARGESARGDASFVEGLAGALGLPIDLGRWDPPRAAHFEADARRARYAWLLDVARARGAKAVAVGHTRDDQAETVLHRILRGTGVRGLAGIPARRALGDSVALIRPLLTTSRQEVRGYLASLGQPFRDDATNLDTSRTRARLRHDLLPKLAAEYNPRVAEALVRLARLAAETDRAYSERVREAFRLAVAPGGRHEGVVFHRDRLMKLPGFLRAEVLRLAWRREGWPEMGMTETRWRRLAGLVSRSRAGKFDVGGGVVAETGGGTFVLRPPPTPASG
jgi:tRNA(Ile)-lysidine synthase